jgi:adenylate cyclase
MWGMETFAHMLAQKLDNGFLRPIATPLHWLGAFGAVILGALTAFSNLRLIFFGPVLLAQFALLVALPFLLAQAGWDTYGLSGAGWLIGWFLALAAVGTALRAIGSEQRRFAQITLGKYLPRDIATEIMRDPANLNLTGQKRGIFVVFTDLENFTKLSHAIEPEMVAKLLNRYLEMLSNVVLEHGGTIDKFVGDAVVAFWGAPISRPDDGARAVKAAIAMHLAGEEFRNTAPDEVPAIGKTRAGLHYGEAIVGNFGGEGRIQYTAIGDSMNAAARLESANKQTKTSVLVSREAVERSGLDFFRPMGRVVLRGRATPIDIFEPVPDMPKEELIRQSKLIEQAIGGDVQAITHLKALCAIFPSDSGLVSLLERLAHQDEGGYFVLD